MLRCHLCRPMQVAALGATKAPASLFPKLTLRSAGQQHSLFWRRASRCLGVKAKRGESGKPQQSEKFRPSEKTRQHPSKDRERARQAEHNRKARQWEPSNSVQDASGDWTEYFDEKWVHNSGRLSDFNLPPREIAAEDRTHVRDMHSARHSRAHSRNRHGPDKSNRSKHAAAEALEQGVPEIEIESAVDGSVMADATTEKESRPANQLSEEQAASSRGRGDASSPRQHLSGGRLPDRALEHRDQEGGGDLWRFFATCHPGLEEVVAEELRGPAIRGVQINTGSAGVTFWGRGLDTGYRACIWLRSAIRVLVLLAEGPLDCSVPAGDALYHWTRQAVDWPDLLPRGQRFSVAATLRDCATIPSTQLIKTRVKDAICDAIRDARGEKLWQPEPERPPELPLYSVLYRDNFSLYRDMALDSLHRRGYRSAMHRASLNEAAAAGLLRVAGWPKPGAVLADPMCGSGTFLIEAALMAQGRAPGLPRQWWPFMSWPDFDPTAWRRCREESCELEALTPRFEGRLLGNDSHAGALSLARRDLEAAGVSGMVSLHHGNCSQWKPEATPSLVVTNPPWGARLASAVQDSLSASSSRGCSGEDGSDAESNAGSLQAAWQDLSVFLKGQCPNAMAYVLSGNAEAASQLYMKATKRRNLSIGGKQCRLLQYHIRARDSPGTAH